MTEYVGQVEGRGRRIAVLVSRFNEEITRRLLAGALAALARAGVADEDLDVVWVPGAWELPVAARVIIDLQRHDAVVALGAVIRGDTAHFAYVAGEAARGLATLQAETGTPIGFGVLTCDDWDQAEARSGGAHGNKGEDAAHAALELVDLFARLDSEPSGGPDPA